MGTLLRAGDQLRAATQLVEAPGGTLLASHTVQAALGDLFKLQDDIAQRVADALALPLGGGEASPTPRAPHNARAYGLYLRANELARSYDQLLQARDLYEQCLELDPEFAPAWAQMGRCERVISKFVGESQDAAVRAEESLRRALELNPRLSIAHKSYAHIEAETGQPRAAMVRLLCEADCHGNDPELFAGLVHACRYCGLFEQSLAAHEEARRLDPNVPTSMEQTLLLAGEIDRLLAGERSAQVSGSDLLIRVVGLGMVGRREESREALREVARLSELPVFEKWTEVLEAWLDRRPEVVEAASTTLGDLKLMDDPEAVFEHGWLLCDIGRHEVGLERLRLAIEKGFSVAPTLSTSRAFDGVRDDPRFGALLARATEDRERALAAFRENGGERLIGPCC